MTTRQFGVASAILAVCLASGCHHFNKTGAAPKEPPIAAMGGNATGTDSPNSEFGKFDKPNP